MKTEKIKLYRMQLGMTQTDFANMIGIDRSYLNQIENGKIRPGMATLEKIARGLNRSLKDFF